MYKRSILCVFLCLVWLAAGCAPTAKVTKTVSPSAPSYAKAQNLYDGIEAMAKKLIASASERQVGKIAVADLVGPGDMITGLGQHVADKVSLHLFSAGAFPDFMERRQLKQVLLSLKKEHSGYFDQRSVKEFGKMVGVDSMVIGTIEDLGTVIDVTVKIIEAGTGRLQGMADVCLIRDDMVVRLLGKSRSATLTVTVEPSVNGIVAIGEKQCRMEYGMATFTEIPYGECQVVIKPEGYKTVCKSIDIRSRVESLSVRLQTMRYLVSFQIVPPNSNLSVDGQKVPLNPNGFAKVPDLEAREYSYVVQAKGYKDRLATFNPAYDRLIALDLKTLDPFFETRDKFFKKFQQVGKKGDFSVKLWTNKSNYQLGDPIVFYFKAERDCYLNLVDINSKGEISLIFPNRYHPNNFVKRGITYRIPDKGYGFSFEVEPPAGSDRIYAIAGTRPLDIFSQDFTQQAFLTMSRSKTRGVKVKGIGVKLDQAQLSAASECVINIRR